MTEKELKSIYGKNIRKFREAKGFTQSILAEQIGIGEKYLSTIETGSTWGSFDTLVKLSEALGVEPYELLLPQGQSVNLDSRKTKALMNRLRGDLSQLMDTIENFVTTD